MAASQMPLLLFALLALTASTSASASAEPTIHEILQKFGLPPGLLPDSVESYTPIPFARIAYGYAVTLKSPCHVKYGSHDLYFDSGISFGIMFRGGRIMNLNGVKLYGSLDVTDIEVRGDSLRLANPSQGFVLFLDSKLFESIPTCEDEALVAAGNPSSKLISQLPVTAA